MKSDKSFNNNKIIRTFSNKKDSRYSQFSYIHNKHLSLCFYTYIQKHLWYQLPKRKFLNDQSFLSGHNTILRDVPPLDLYEILNWVDAAYNCDSTSMLMSQVSAVAGVAMIESYWHFGQVEESRADRAFFMLFTWTSWRQTNQGDYGYYGMWVVDKHSTDWW